MESDRPPPKSDDVYFCTRPKLLILTAAHMYIHIYIFLSIFLSIYIHVYIYIYLYIWCNLHRDATLRKARRPDSTQGIAFLAHSQRSGRGVRDFRRELVHKVMAPRASATANSLRCNIGKSINSHQIFHDLHLWPMLLGWTSWWKLVWNLPFCWTLCGW